MQRIFRDALYPRLLYRMEAQPELWPVNLGSNQTFTRTGLIAPVTEPLSAGQDPTPQTYNVEQWEATAEQYGNAIDTHMPTSYVTLASLYLRNMHQLGLNSGQSLNRIARNKMFNRYLGGNTVVATAGAGIGTASIPVDHIAGFTTVLVNGRPTAVSATNTLRIRIGPVGGATETILVQAVTPTTAGDTVGPGTLTTSTNLTATYAARIAVIADTAVKSGTGITSIVRNIYQGGGETIDALASTDILDLSGLRTAVAQLRFDNVPPHEDGSYHCHLDPVAESQIFADNEFQRLNQSIPDYIHYRRFAVAYLLGMTFYRNSEAPTSGTVGSTESFAGDMANATSVPIHRTIITGQGVLDEKYLDESKYISEAGVQGKIGEFAVVNNGIQVMTERIRLILRAPLDRLQQLTGSAWSWSGDFPVPTDSVTTTSNSDYKRAVVLLHGE
uniref:Putative capsid protein n=1 Tax=viral metagenome TaxID=1070528 RepID=A0A6H1Z9T4_9ZZZZ